MAAKKKNHGDRNERSTPADALGLLLSVIVILVCVLLLKSLTVWLEDDLAGSFSRIWATVTGSVFITK